MRNFIVKSVMKEAGILLVVNGACGCFGQLALARVFVDCNHGDESCADEGENLFIRRVWFIIEQMMLSRIIAFLKHQFIVESYHSIGTH